MNKMDDLSKPETVTINLPEHALPTLPVPGGKTDVNVAGNLWHWHSIIPVLFAVVLKWKHTSKLLSKQA